MVLTFEQGALLLLIAAVVAMMCRRLRLPYSVGLVLAGISVALLPFAPRVNLTKELLFTVLLPPLIFEAALDLNWNELRKELPLVLVLATVGVVLSAGVTAAGMHYLANWQWISALFFGVLIAATDPVSVIATFKNAKVRGRLRLLIESESLLNDGTAAVLYAICLDLALGDSPTTLKVIEKLGVTIGGSLACGAIVAGGALLLAYRTDDPLVEITFTTVTASGSFLLAEHLHLSGVLATLIAGLMLGNLGHLGAISERGREAVRAFWEYSAFVANSLVFLLIGIRVAQQNFLTGWSSILLAFLLVTFGRAIAVYPCCAPFMRSTLHVPVRHQHIMFWGGLRGSLALALAMALPAELPQRAAVITVTFAVVAFSVLIQSLTLIPILRRIHLSG